MATSGIVRTQAAEGLSLVGDRDMMRTLTLALLSNAIRFQQKDIPPSVDVAFERSPTEWSMAVTDNGIGIEPRFFPRMFEMFSRFHPVGDHAGAGVGVGVGLALSKRIIDCHGGKLTVHPNPKGPGTSFVISVPIPSNGLTNSLETGRYPYYDVGGDVQNSI